VCLCVNESGLQARIALQAALPTALRRTGNAAVYIYVYACVYVCIHVRMRELLSQLRCIALVTQLSVDVSTFVCKYVSKCVYISCLCDSAASHWRRSCLYVRLCCVGTYVPTYVYISDSYDSAASPHRHCCSPPPVAVVTVRNSHESPRY